MFDDDEFTKGCHELDSPDVKGWEFFCDTNNVRIYRLYNEVTSLYSYKIYGTLEKVTPDVCAKVYMDLEYRKTWDSYVVDLREFDSAAKKSIYWQVKFPFPLSNRDYVYTRELRDLDLEGRHVRVVLAKAVVEVNQPPVHGVVRVEEYIQSLAITSDGKSGTKAFMRYYDNPGGMIPTWLVNWAAKKGVPSFLTDMEKACLRYPDYLANLPSEGRVTQQLETGSLAVPTELESGSPAASTETETKQAVGQ